MDRRTLFFVCALSATLFLVNAVFTYMDRDKFLLIEQQQQAKKEQKDKKLSEAIQAKTATLREFNIVEVYIGGAELPSAKGVIVEDTLISFAWQTPAPKDIVILNTENGKEVEKTLHLINNSAHEGEVLLYAEKSDQKLLNYKIAPLGSYDLQMLVFSTQGSVTPVYGELKDGDLTVPLQALAKENKNSYQYPEGNTLVFTKIEGRYLPVGVYISKEDSLIPFASLPSVDDHLKFLSQDTGAPQEEDEKFYLIETPYQQLLFSNRGAALVEINLPFESKEHPASVVREVEADRNMVKNDPQNAMFPARGYHSAADPKKVQLGKLGGYYPLLRRDLIAKNPKNTILVQPTYYAFNIISNFPEVAEQIFTVSHFDSKSITFESKQPHRRITKTYTLPQDPQTSPYCLDLVVKIEGDSRGLWLTSGVPDVEWISGSAAPALKFRITRDGKPDVESLSLPNEAFTTTTTTPDWVCTSNGFFGIILDPLTSISPGYRALKIPGQVLPSRLVELNQGQESYDPNKMPGYAMMLPIAGGESHFRIYSGPLAEGILKKVDATFSDSATNYNPDYLASISFHGWFSFISAPFTKVLLFLMEIFYSITGSWAFSIVLLTIALRLMLYPLNSWSMKAMARTQEIAPLVQKIQQKHKNDKQKMQLEIATLYREKKINPLSGCVPMLIQIPFLISMFDLLKSTFALRGAPFIPGWIDNLSAPDVLFDWGFSIPFIGSEFHLLPILLGGVMFLQTRMSTKAPSPSDEITDAQRQQKAMGTMMPVLFTFMFYSFPSGLNIYWLSSTLMGIGQQWLTNKKLQSSKPLEIKKEVRK